MDNSNLPLMAGALSTTIFALSTLPMLFKAFRTKDLSSYSLGNILLANVGNVVHDPEGHAGVPRRGLRVRLAPAVRLGDDAVLVRALRMAAAGADSPQDARHGAITPSYTPFGERFSEAVAIR